MSKAKVMYIPAGGKTAVWGPVDKDVLPEGYPYKEQSEEVLIPETLCSFVMDAGGSMGTVPEPDNYRKFVVGEKLHLILNGEVYEGTATSSTIAEFPTNIGDGFVCQVKFVAAAAYYTITTLLEGDVTVKLIATSETIHPMAAEFLPAGVGGAAIETVDPSVPLDSLQAEKWYLLNGIYTVMNGSTDYLYIFGAIAFVRDRGSSRILSIFELDGRVLRDINLSTGAVLYNKTVNAPNSLFYDDSGNLWKLRVDSDGNVSAEKQV